MIDDQQRVSIISEALPYLREFHGKTFVIKYGGSSMIQPQLKQQVIDDIALLHYIGVKVVVVHGGGPEINRMLERLGIESYFERGLRVTDEKSMEIVEMVLTGKVQKELVSLLNRSGAKAIGLSGKDGLLMQAQKFSDKDFDWDRTGKVQSVNPHILQTLLSENYLPIISSTSPDAKQNSYNINADNVASEIAISLQAEKIIFLTDTPGILKQDQLIKKVSRQLAHKLISEGTVTGGMLPKLQNAIDCLERGVNSVHILNGTHEHVLLLEIFTEKGVGSMVTL